MSAAEPAELQRQVVATLRTLHDPELPVNIYDLGLIYQLDVSPAGAVAVRMTLTTPACPVARVLPGQVETKLKALPGVTDVKVELVWDPPWSRERLSPEARLQLGLDEPGRRRRRFVSGASLLRRKDGAGD